MRFIEAEAWASEVSTIRSEVTRCSEPTREFRTRSEYDEGMTLVAGRPAATRRSSDLSKHSAKVFAEAEDHPVTVTRRDGESLVLMSQREADARAELLSIAATLLAAALEDGPLTEHMASRFPWMYALRVEDRDECARDLIDAARASFATHQPHLVITTLTSWRETATAIAAGLGVQTVEWIDEDEETAVERPRRPSPNR
jgi:hypothetical protein